MHLKNGRSAGCGAYARKGTTPRAMVANKPHVSLWPNDSTSPRNYGWLFVSGSGSTAPLFLNLDARWKWIIIFMFPSLHPLGNLPSYQLYIMLVGLHSRLQRLVQENNFTLLGIKPGRPALSPSLYDYTFFI
jgi:hypothetical protein